MRNNQHHDVGEVLRRASLPRGQREEENPHHRRGFDLFPLLLPARTWKESGHVQI